ncbi:MAG: cobyrinate a,c-diamide synthase [Hominisplanchenecus sp.]|nr:cobyrinate a,c-diamide synthase [Hominisplanchenecus sp.]
MSYPRFMLAATARGSGKTLITCGSLKLLKDRGMKVSSFKCGPDYIDPMFHAKVLETVSRNLDTFFTEEEMTCYLFARTAQQTDLSVMEGVMGFYDGLGGVDVKASAYDLARVTDTPVILILNAKGMSLSVLAQIRGFLSYRRDSHIRGVILNQMSGMLCKALTPQIEQELGVKVYGYVPPIPDWKLESRHLGLVLPDEVEDLQQQLQRLAAILENSLDVEGLLALAQSAPELSAPCPSDLEQLLSGREAEAVRRAAPEIAVAKDEAFCFLYKDNLRLLEELGARIVPFSPLHDSKVPPGIAGMLLPGGYPELYAKELSDNKSMLGSIKECVDNGVPTLAECGGFMYLHREMENMEKEVFQMAGVIDGRAYHTEKLGRFGYITLTPADEEKSGRSIVRGHEFHYFDSTSCGEDYVARKPAGRRSWKCIHAKGNLMAGFPHLYYYSNPEFVLDFLKKCCEGQERNTNQ